MTHQPKANQAASVMQRLRNLTKNRDEDFNLILTRYALERFLYRLSASSHRSNLILKGAMLFELWSETPHRATRDMDFLAQGDNTDVAALTQIVRDVCTASVEDDGIIFDLTALQVAHIRESDRYGGVRARFFARLSSARISVQLDFGFGDVVTPAPTETDYPALLGMQQPRVLAYPRETVVAEKLEAIVDLGMDNSRMKDFFDLWFIFTTFEDDPNLLSSAVSETFKRRRQTIPSSIPSGLSDDFANNSSKQEQWAAFAFRALEGAPNFHDVITLVREVAMGLFDAARKPPER